MELTSTEPLIIKIKNLPLNIINYIYKEFFETEYYYYIYKNAVNSETSRHYDIRDLYPHISIILSKPSYVKYFSENDRIFSIVYYQHKIKNNKNFILMTKGQSFAQCILMYYWH
jgi:hypothetical protein